MSAAGTDERLIAPPLDLRDVSVVMERCIDGPAKSQKLAGRRLVEQTPDQIETGIVCDRDAPLPDLGAIASSMMPMAIQ